MFLLNFNILFDNRYGFRCSKSTDKKYVFGLFLDLFKAFDSLSIDFARVNIFALVRSFLVGKETCVKVNRKPSGKRKLNC